VWHQVSEGKEAVKPSTIVFLVLASLGTLGYLCYGWLLLETLSSKKGLLASFTFTNLFILWLLPILIGLVLVAIQLVRKKQHYKKNGRFES